MIYVFMVLVALLAVGLVTRPWWGGAAAPQLRRRAANVAAYRTRLAEMEAEVAAGVLGRDAADAMRGELDAQLLHDAQAAEPGAGRPALGRRAGLALAALLVAFGTLGYWWQGSWRDHAVIETSRRDPEAAQAQAIERMVAGLERRLEASPQDAEGWAMLGRSKVVMSDYAAGAAAYGKANELTAYQNPDWLVGEGEALAVARDRDLLGTPQRRFNEALAIAPDHHRALWYAGLAAGQAGDYERARAHWLRLRAQDIPDPLRDVLDARLQALGAPAAPAPPDEAPAAAVALRLQLRVRVADALLAQRKPGQVLFVFAKADGGPPMPLAVQKLDQPQLPLELSLDDSMGMLPALKLSGFDRWAVTARLSSSGDVKGAPGDLEGSRAVTRADAARPIELVIDRVMP